MKNILVILCLLFCACGAMKKNSASNNASGQTEAKAIGDTSEGQSIREPELQDKEPFRLVISFFSRGEGADGKAIERFLAYVNSYQASTGKTIDYDKTPWGREGEVDYCMKLLNLDPEAQKVFITQVREVLVASQLVHIGENTPCTHKR